MKLMKKEDDGSVQVVQLSNEIPGSLKRDTLGSIIMFAFFGLSGHLIF